MSRPRPVRAVAALLALPLVACDSGHEGRAHSERAFTWSGRVPDGGWVRVRDLNGSVRVARAPGREVIITATKRWRGGRPQAVRFVAEPDARGITACALWGGAGTCTPDAYGSRGERRGRERWFTRLFRREASVRVDYVVAVPAGVSVDARTTNGSVVVADATSEVVARTVNGSITLGGSGRRMRGETVNGSVRARLDAWPAGAAVALKSVNGSVTALLPDAASAEVALQTTNGRVRSDFAVASTKENRRTLRGTLNGGQGRIALETVNGSVTLGRL